MRGDKEVLRHRLFLVTAIAAVAGLAFILGRPLDLSRAPNVILITVDTLRADHLGAYGYPRATSPNFDAFANEGMLFRRAFSHSPETNPSLSNLMSSFYPHETQVLRIFHVLPEAVMTLSEVLKDHGWRTAAIVSNYMLRRGSGFEQGFDEYDDRMDDPGESHGVAALQRIASKTSAAAIEWLRQHRDGRFFLWVHYMDPHVPYTPPPPYDTMFTASAGEHRPLLLLPKEGITAGRNLGGIPYSARLGDHTDAHYYVAQYDGEIRFLDESLGQLLGEIRTLGLLDKSLVIVTADHAEGMGEHDFFFNHTEFVFTSVIHIPLVVRLPDAAGRGQQINEPVSLSDVFPTVLKVTGIRLPEGIRGQSLLDPRPKPIVAHATFASGHTTVIQHGHALVVDRGRPGRPELYDLAHDFYETRNLLEDGNPEATRMASEMTETFKAIAKEDALRLGAPIEWAIQRDEKDKLRTLGYVQ
jgi:arylsulfatase